MLMIIMSHKNNLKSGVSRVDARHLLVILNHIATHGKVANPELQELTGLSRATIARLIANAKEQYGVEITWRRDNSMPSHGEYTIEHWGVFDRAKVIEFLDKQ